MMGRKPLEAITVFAEDLELDIHQRSFWRLGMSCLSKSL